MPKSPAKTLKPKDDVPRQYRFRDNPDAKLAFKILNQDWAAANLPVVKGPPSH